MKRTFVRVLRTPLPVVSPRRQSGTQTRSIRSAFEGGFVAAQQKVPILQNLHNARNSILRLIHCHTIRFPASGSAAETTPPRTLVQIVVQVGIWGFRTELSH